MIHLGDCFYQIPNHIEATKTYMHLKLTFFTKVFQRLFILERSNFLLQHTRPIGRIKTAAIEKLNEPKNFCGENILSGNRIFPTKKRRINFLKLEVIALKCFQKQSLVSNQRPFRFRLHERLHPAPFSGQFSDTKNTSSDQS